MKFQEPNFFQKISKLFFVLYIMAGFILTPLLPLFVYDNLIEYRETWHLLILMPLPLISFFMFVVGMKQYDKEQEENYKFRFGRIED
jgi:hypothetical protein